MTRGYYIYPWCLYDVWSVIDLGSVQQALRGPRASLRPLHPRDKRGQEAVQGRHHQRALWHQGDPEEHGNHHVSTAADVGFTPSMGRDGFIFRGLW